MPEKVSKEQWIGIAAIALLLGVVVAILGWSNRHRQRSEQPVVYVIADSSEIPPVTKEGSAPKVVRRLDPNTGQSDVGGGRFSQIRCTQDVTLSRQRRSL